MGAWGTRGWGEKERPPWGWGGGRRETERIYTAAPRPVRRPASVLVASRGRRAALFSFPATSTSPKEGRRFDAPFPAPDFVDRLHASSERQRSLSPRCERQAPGDILMPPRARRRRPQLPFSRKLALDRWIFSLFQEEDQGSYVGRMLGGWTWGAPPTATGTTGAPERTQPPSTPP